MFDCLLDGKSLERVLEIKYLGIVFDTKLTCQSHLKFATSKSFKFLRFSIGTTKHFRSLNSIKSLHYSLDLFYL